MSQVKVVYWSGTGNTEAMAKAIAEGASGELLEMEKISPAELKETPVLALGCPAMGDEVLEETIAEPFMEELEPMIKGKQIALFGSYGWGDGQWMRDWEERIRTKGGLLAEDQGLICCEEPDEETLEKCRILGENLKSL